MNRPLVLIVVLVTAALAQEKKRAPQKQPLRTGYAVAPVLFKDEGCARDYLKAVAAGGLSMRKQLAELVQYGCAEKAVGVYRGATLEKKTLPPNAAAIHRVSMVCASYCGDKLVLSGWIAAKDFHVATESEMQEVIKALAEK